MWAMDLRPVPALAVVACGASIACALAPAGAVAATPAADRNGALGFVATRHGDTSLYLRKNRRHVRRIRMGGNPPANPAFSPLGRRIAFDRSSRTGRDIWVMQADGADLRRVTPAPGREEDPAWSRHEDRIAYAGGPRGDRDIFAIGADGNDVQRLTHSRRDESQPAWSARGTIAFVRHNRRGDDLYLMDGDGHHTRRLTAGRTDESEPAFSPGGSSVVFMRTTQKRRVIPKHGHHPRRVIPRRPAGLYVISLDGDRKPRLLIALRGDSEPSPTWSPNGRWIVFSGGRPGHRRLYAITPGGHRLHALTRPSSDGRTPDWQPAGADPVIAAAGDIACGTTNPRFLDGLGDGLHCGQMLTSNLLLRMDLWDVLIPGDVQYFDGAYDQYLQSFDPSWGRVKSLLRPVPGNHDYHDPGAQGYFDYFNGIGNFSGPAGDRDKGYYSFDVGRWHIVALNSACPHVPGGCAPGSPQEQWLRADLARNPARCTLAFMHNPLHDAGGDADDDPTEEQTSTGDVASLWQALYDADADVVINGHDHLYARFISQDPQGNPDHARGLREFTVGTGGKSSTAPNRLLYTNTTVVNGRTFGVLKLTLRPASYAWQFVPIAGRHFRDSGAASCH